jgi:hypothetical protein
MALDGRSPLCNKGGSYASVLTDARGKARADASGLADIGAYKYTPEAGRNAMVIFR